MDRQRIDKWLWHARMVRTRGDAAALADAGHVRINGRRVAASSQQVRVGDVLEVYTHVDSIGRTSMKIHVEAWARRFQTRHHEKVTDAHFTFVAIDDNGRPRPIPPS